MSKFLSYEDRLIIAQRLQESASFGEIGKELGRDRTTIAKEVKKYSIVSIIFRKFIFDHSVTGRYPISVSSCSRSISSRCSMFM